MGLNQNNEGKFVRKALYQYSDEGEIGTEICHPTMCLCIKHDIYKKGNRKWELAYTEYPEFNIREEARLVFGVRSRGKWKQTFKKKDEATKRQAVAIPAAENYEHKHYIAYSQMIVSYCLT